MPYELFANVTALIHAALIVCVFIGIFISIRMKWFRPIESSFLLIAVVIWSLYGACPLTSLEIYLRNKANISTLGLQESGFIAHDIGEFFGFYLKRSTIELWTYAIVILFIFLTIEWLVPFIKKIPVLKHVHK